MRSQQESRHNFNTLNLAQRTRTRTPCGPSRPAGRSNSRVVADLLPRQVSFAAARPQPAHEAQQRDARPGPGRARDVAA